MTEMDQAEAVLTDVDQKLLMKVGGEGAALTEEACAATLRVDAMDGTATETDEAWSATLRVDVEVEDSITTEAECTGNPGSPESLSELWFRDRDMTEEELEARERESRERAIGYFVRCALAREEEERRVEMKIEQQRKADEAEKARLAARGAPERLIDERNLVFKDGWEHNISFFELNEGEEEKSLDQIVTQVEYEIRSASQKIEMNA